MPPRAITKACALAQLAVCFPSSVVREITVRLTREGTLHAMNRSLSPEAPLCGVRPQCRLSSHSYCSQGPGSPPPPPESPHQCPGPNLRIGLSWSAGAQELMFLVSSHEAGTAGPHWALCHCSHCPVPAPLWSFQPGGVSGECRGCQTQVGTTILLDISDSGVSLACSLQREHNLQHRWSQESSGGRTHPSQELRWL